MGIGHELKEIKSGRKELRSFGITVGIAFSLLACLFWWRQKDFFVYFFLISAFLLVFGIAAPGKLKVIQRGWMTLAIIMGWFMTRLILIVLFYLAITPIALLARLFRKKFLDLDFNRDADSYWIEKEEDSFDKKRCEMQF